MSSLSLGAPAVARRHRPSGGLAWQIGFTILAVLVLALVLDGVRLAMAFRDLNSQTHSLQSALAVLGTDPNRWSPQSVTTASSAAAHPARRIHDDARMIEVITPSGFEKFFRELTEVFQAGPPDPNALESLAASYGLFFDPTWVPELMAKYGLNSPFG